MHIYIIALESSSRYAQQNRFAVAKSTCLSIPRIVALPGVWFCFDEKEYLGVGLTLNKKRGIRDQSTKKKSSKQIKVRMLE
jgi:hypothetical protein